MAVEGINARQVAFKGNDDRGGIGTGTALLGAGLAGAATGYGTRAWVQKGEDMTADQFTSKVKAGEEINYIEALTPSEKSDVESLQKKLKEAKATEPESKPTAESKPAAASATEGSSKELKKANLDLEIARNSREAHAQMADKAQEAFRAEIINEPKKQPQIEPKERGKLQKRTSSTSSGGNFYPKSNKKFKQERR